MTSSEAATAPALLLIDSATSGTSGGYIDAIWRALGERASVEVGVNFHFPFNYGRKWFFKYTELSSQERYRLGKARLYVRFLELCVAFFRLTWLVARKRIPVVVYAISSNLLIEYWFLWFLKNVLGTRVMLICHDLVPFSLPGVPMERMIRTRRRFYELADRLVVHNENSVLDLKTVFSIDADKVSAFPFPIYDLPRMRIAPVPVLPPSTRRRFLFLGHLRAEKGIDVLLDAWKRFHGSAPDAELIIAGNLPAGRHYDFEPYRHLNLQLVLRFLSDAEYIGLLGQVDCVVLPYARGTNSAVLSTVLCLRKDLIVSDIGMFTNHPLVPRESLFKAGDSASLAERLSHFAARPATPGVLQGPAPDAQFARYETEFREQARKLFASPVGA